MIVKITLLRKELQDELEKIRITQENIGYLENKYIGPTKYTKAIKNVLKGIDCGLCVALNIDENIQLKK